MHTVMVHGLGQEMSMETCLAPHLFEKSKNFLGRNPPRHTTNQETKNRRGRGECHPFVFLICHLALHGSWDQVSHDIDVLTCEWARSCEVGRGYRMGLLTNECYTGLLARYINLILLTPGDNPYGKRQVSWFSILIQLG